MKERLIFKLFCADEAALDSFSGEVGRRFDGVRFNVEQSGVDFKCSFIVDGANNAAPDEAVKEFLERFDKEIYAADDVSVEQRFFDIMKLSGRKLATAESMTGGNIAATLVKIAGASEFFYEGLVTYDTRAKYARLGVSQATVASRTVVSAEVAYEMARGLIGENASVGISITGYAPSLSENANDGLCYICVAVDENAKVYRYRFSGDRKEVIEKATSAAFYSAIKTLKEIG